MRLASEYFFVTVRDCNCEYVVVVFQSSVNCSPSTNPKRLQKRRTTWYVSFHLIQYFRFTLLQIQGKQFQGSISNHNCVMTNTLYPIHLPCNVL